MIDDRNSLIATDVKEYYQKFHDSYTQEERRNILVSHFGTFSQDLINSLSEGIEELMISVGDKSKLIKRVFSILIEGLQNIRIHGEKDEFGRQLGFMIIAKNDDSYKINLGNIIRKKDAENLEKHLVYINSLKDEDLKNYYMEVLTDGFVTQKGGAGLGFITMKLKSESPIGFTIEKLSDDSCFFSVEVFLKRTTE